MAQNNPTVDRVRWSADQPRDIAILRLSALGDVSHVVAVVRAIQEQRPAWRLTWITGKHEHRLLSVIDGVEFILFDKRAGISEYARLRKTLAGRRFDALLHMQLAARANLAAAMIKAKVKVGFDRARSRELHSLFINSRIAAAQNQHVVQALMSFIVPLGLEATTPVWKWPIKAADRRLIRAHVGTEDRVLVISPCSSHPLRNWQADRYAAVADYAIEQLQMKVILVGGPSQTERAMAADIERHMVQSAINLVGQDTLPELMATLERADVVVAPDSGPAHFANAVGTPVIGLYAATDPCRSGPFNSLQWCINRYDRAARRYLGQPASDLRWGKKIETDGVMQLIEVKDVLATLEQIANRP